MGSDEERSVIESSRGLQVKLLLLALTGQRCAQVARGHCLASATGVEHAQGVVLVVGDEEAVAVKRHGAGSVAGPAEDERLGGPVRFGPLRFGGLRFGYPRP